MDWNPPCVMSMLPIKTNLTHSLGRSGPLTPFLLVCPLSERLLPSVQCTLHRSAAQCVARYNVFHLVSLNFQPFWAPGGLEGPQNAINMVYVAISGSGGPNWVEQSGTRVEQVRGHIGRWVGTFSRFQNCPQWAPGGLKMA